MRYDLVEAPLIKGFAMVAPVTSIPDTIMGGVANAQPNPRSWIVRRTRQTQKPPFNLVLNYEITSRSFVSMRQEGYPQAYNCDVYYPQSPEGHSALSFGTYNQATTIHQNALSDLANKLNARLMSKLGDPASLGITLVQYRQAMDMMTNRLTSVYLFARDLKKLRIRSAIDRLVHANGSEQVRKRLRDTEARMKRTAKDFAGNFLELHFGWVPLAQDVYQSMEVLSAPIPYGKLRVSAKVLVDAEKLDYLNFWETQSTRHKAVYRGVTGCEVQVTNPNLYLLNQMGLLNPSAVVWDAIPWSFVAGWFWNVDQYLRSFTDFAGCTVTNGYWNTTISSAAERTRSNRYPGYQGQSIVNTSAKSFRRINSLPDVTLRAKGIKLPSVTRGLTAASLLAQFLKG